MECKIYKKNYFIRAMEKEFIINCVISFVINKTQKIDQWEISVKGRIKYLESRTNNYCRVNKDYTITK